MQLISSLDGGEWLPLPTVAAGVQPVGGLVGPLGGWALSRTPSLFLQPAVCCNLTKSPVWRD